MKRFVQFVLLFVFISVSALLAENKKAITVRNKPTTLYDFVENKGQWDSQADFFIRTNSCDVWLSKGNLVLNFIESKGKKNNPDYDRLSSAENLKGHILLYNLVGSQSNPKIEYGEKKVSETSFILGDKPTINNIHSYTSVTYSNVYSGIDFLLNKDNGRIRYNFIVNPGADASNIKLKISGAEKMTIDGTGNLNILTSVTNVTNSKPVAYQLIAGTKKLIDCEFELNEDIITFDLSSYDKSYPVIIDPTIVAMNFGGSGDEDVTDFEVATNGDIICTGNTSTTKFPTPIPGSYKVANQGLIDGFISRFDNDLTNLLSATFIGGSDNDYPNAIKINSAGEILIAGYTNSSNYPFPTGSLEFPTAPTTPTYGFVSKLDANLQNLLISYKFYYSHILDLDLDASDNVYLTGWGVDKMVTKAGGYQVGFPAGAGACGFVIKLNDIKKVIEYATYVGKNLQAGKKLSYKSICVKNGIATILGTTDGSGLSVTANAINATKSGTNNNDAYLAQLDATGSNINYASYIGSSNEDYANNVKVGDDGAIVCMLTTNSLKMLTMGNVFQKANNGGFDYFILKLSPTFDYTFGSFMGGSSNEGLNPVYTTDTKLENSLYVDKKDFVYFGGTTASVDFPLAAPEKILMNGNSEGVFGVLNLESSDDQPIFSSYVGGSGNDAVKEVFSSDRCNMLVVGTSDSPDIAANYVAGQDLFATKYVFIPEITLSPDTTVCEGTKAYVRAKVKGVPEYSFTWEPLDGIDNVASLNPAILIPTSKQYTLTVNYCGGKKVFKNVLVSVNPIPVTTVVGSSTLCEGDSVLLAPANKTYEAYYWYLGDKLEGFGANFYAKKPGNYRLEYSDWNCKGEAFFTVTLLPNPKPHISGNNIICRGESVTLTASGGHPLYRWRTDGGEVGMGESITVNYSALYMLDGISSNGCIRTDSLFVAKKDLDFSASSVVFNNVKTNEVVETTIDVTNSGTLPYTINDFPIVKGPFQITKMDPNPLYPGQTGIVTVVFSGISEAGVYSEIAEVKEKDCAVGTKIELIATVNRRLPIIGSIGQLVRRTQCENPYVDSIPVYSWGELPIQVTSCFINGDPLNEFKIINFSGDMTIPVGDTAYIHFMANFKKAGTKNVTFDILSNAANTNEGKKSIPVTIYKDSSAMSFSTNNLDFGFIPISTPATRTFKLINTGSTRLYWKLPINSGAYYKIDRIVPLPVKPGDTATVSVTFSGSPNPSTFPGLFNLEDSCGRVTQLKVTATVSSSKPPSLQTDNNFNFGELICKATKDSSIIIQNVGGADLLISDAVYETGDNQKFALTMTSKPMRIKTGDKGSIKLTYIPGFAGVHTSKLKLSTNATNATNGEYFVTVTGKKDSIGVSFSPNPLDFGPIVAATPATNNLTVTNTGDRAINLTLPVTIGKFTVQSATVNPIPPGANSVLTVNFAGDAAGTIHSEVYEITDECGNKLPVTIKASVKTNEAGIDVAKTVDIKSESCSSNAKDTAIVIHNIGGATLTINSASFTGTNSSEFVVKSTIPKNIAASTDDSILVSFIPKSSGTKTAKLTLNTNATNVTGGISEIDVKGIKDSVNLAFEGSTIDLGPVCQSQLFDYNLVVKNTGSVDNTAFVTAESGVTVVDASKAVVAGSSSNVKISFTPENIQGNYSKEITMKDAICGTEVKVTLKYYSTIPVVKGGPFTIYADAGNSANKDVFVKNETGADIVVSSATFSNAKFQLVSPSVPFTIKKMDSLSIRVKYSSTADTQESGILSLGSKLCDYISDIQFNGAPNDVIVGTMTIKPGSFSASPGQVVDLPIIIESSSDVAKTKAKTITAKLYYNPTVILPKNLVATSVNTIESYVEVTFDAKDGKEYTVKTIPCVIALGNVKSGTLKLKDATPDQGKINISTVDGTFKITDICVQGGERLFNPNGIAAPIVKPSYASKKVNIEFKAIEDGLHEIQIVDYLGREVLKPVYSYTAAGTYSIDVDLSNIPDGFYLVVFKTPTIIKSTTFTKEEN